MYYTVYAVIVTILAMLLLAVQTVNVSGADPLTSPDQVTIDDVRAFRNLAEDGDILYVFQKDEDFTSQNGTYPSVPASDSVLYRLYASDNVTLLATESPFVFSFFDTNGYGDGVGAFYFGADDTKPTWGDAVIINIYGSPTYFSPAFSTSRTLSASDYVSATTQDDNRSELQNYIYLLCDRLEALYADTDIILKASSDSGIVLSTYGELLFRGVIAGMQALCPDLFFIQVFIPGVMTVESYNMTMAEEYANRLAGDDLGLTLARIGDFVGGSASGASVIIYSVVSIIICVWTIKKQWGLEPGLVICMLIGAGLSLLVGDAIFTLMMIGSLLCALGIVWLIALRK